MQLGIGINQHNTHTQRNHYHTTNSRLFITIYS